MDDKRRQLKVLGKELARILKCSHTGHIQPLITGSSESALALSHKLAEGGYKVLPIRTPTVPPGTERLRFSLSANLTINQLDKLESILYT